MDTYETTERIERISAHYAERFGLERSQEWFMLKLQEEMGELTQAFMNLHGMGRDRGQTGEEIRQDFVDECADVFGQFLLFARHHGVDLDQAVAHKWLRWERSAGPDES